MTLATELAAAREGALVHARLDLAAFAITGNDRLTWLNALVTQDVGKLAPSAGAYSLAVGKTGRILAELWIVAAPDRVFVVAARDRVELLRQHFDKHLVMEDAEIGEATERGVIFLHGPLARDLVVDARALGADAALIDWTGGRGAAVLISAENKAETLVEAILARAGEQGARASEEGWEAIRIAWGVPRMGVDFDDQTLPQEAALERLAVSFSKGCYLGQETVFMLEKRGHARRRLSRLAIEGSEPVAIGAEISADSAVGSITSVTANPEGEGLLALGYVKHKLAVAGTALTVSGRAARVL